MEALELRFTSRSLEAGSGSDITREDAIKVSSVSSHTSYSD